MGIILIGESNNEPGHGGEVPETYTFPVIREGTNYAAIGTKGGHGGEVPSGLVPKVVSAMDGVDFLRIEARANFEAIGRRGYHPFSIEKLSASVVGQWEPLPWTAPDGKIIMDFAPEYGMPEELYEMHCILPSIILSPKTRLEFGVGGLEEFIENHQERILENVKGGDGILVWADKIDVERGLGNIDKNWGLFLGSLQEKTGPHNVLMDYAANLTCYAIWKPHLDNLRKQNPDAKLGVVCGGKHIDFVADVLEGKETNPPSTEALDKLKAELVLI